MNLIFIEKCIDFYGNVNLQDLYKVLSTVNYLKIYTDGSTCFNGIRKSGIGIYSPDNEFSLAKIVDTKDNNECEIIACIEALKISENYQFIHIFTDSKLIVDKMNGICRTDKCKNLFDELIKMNNQFIDVKYTHVKGHSGIEGNEKADALSRSLIYF